MPHAFILLCDGAKVLILPEVFSRFCFLFRSSIPLNQLWGIIHIFFFSSSLPSFSPLVAGAGPEFAYRQMGQIGLRLVEPPSSRFK